VKGEWPGSRVLGVDACKAGWIGIALGSGHVAAYTAARIDELVAAVSADGRVEVVAIDIPIGLPDAGTRQADQLARAVVGARWSSVFKTPVLEALLAPDHPTAIAINRRLTGAGVSAQAFALRAKLLQVDAWVRNAESHVVEVHPEVSFAALASAPLPDPKSTWAGATHRRRLLADAGIELPDDLGPAGAGAAVDDVLDAAVAAWTARRVAHGHAKPMPDPPEVFSDGLPAAIWA
jgi:predicted RNase H-like nuclease